MLLDNHNIIRSLAGEGKTPQQELVNFLRERGIEEAESFFDELYDCFADCISADKEEGDFLDMFLATPDSFPWIEFVRKHISDFEDIFSSNNIGEETVQRFSWPYFCKVAVVLAQSGIPAEFARIIPG